MCLTEALLRIPDDETADRLIAEKIASGHWDAHARRSGSLFVNASTWGLMLTGKLVDLPRDITTDAGGWLRGLSQRVTEPIVRNALRRAISAAKPSDRFCTCCATQRATCCKCWRIYRPTAMA